MESPNEPSLRIEVRRTVDVALGIGASEWFANSETICAAVEDWLEQVRAGE